MLTLLYALLQLIKPILVPLCFVGTWFFLAALGWSLVSAIRDTLKRGQLMHAVPCSKCQFFTNDHRLKCTIDPLRANTEQAIGCLNYCPKKNPFSIP
ncbi:MAG: hypothetical protein SW833_18105 [Cyanobacteriota bacterium]|nr:hypothetical protein [Cyanobacteriota bacterium]